MAQFDEYIENIKKDIEFLADFNSVQLNFKTTWGIFSPKEIDLGTKVLTSHLKLNTYPKTVLDLGCGYGAIGLFLAKQYPKAEVYMVDKDFVAVKYSKINAEINQIKNVHVFLSNGFEDLPDQKFDIIVSNLPAKVGKELFHIWLDESKKRLNQNGELWVVTIAGLKDFIKRNFKLVFGNYTKVITSHGFTVAKAVKE